ncbi:hypothetical protein PTTG_01862 [Puccinia triticina 1-1 BBBD Race 1]|uniref:Uncharacterized protein n=1 Tax=Puccinia triticina (isolate 1-1 / race 1 (BBBD)) TaxID=630390 RepID=A0A180G9A6_PUCT1|nr:hypothetical protein PTTG_01862 [Puccinia triticina 1-1 BBBD Race 1]
MDSTANFTPSHPAGLEVTPSWTLMDTASPSQQPVTTLKSPFPDPAPKRQRGLQMKPNSSKEIATSSDEEPIQTKHCKHLQAHPSQNGPSLRERITPASTADHSSSARLSRRIADSVGS